MPSKHIEVPEPTDTDEGVLLEIRGGASPRVTVAYRGDAKVWGDGDPAGLPAMPNGLKTKIAAALKAAIAAAKGEWGY